MSRLSQSDRVVEVLKENSKKRLTAQEVAALIISSYPEDYISKRSNPRF